MIDRECRRPNTEINGYSGVGFSDAFSCKRDWTCSSDLSFAGVSWCDRTMCLLLQEEERYSHRPAQTQSQPEHKARTAVDFALTSLPD